MNNTITLSQLITRLAKSTEVDNNTARRFLREFFSTIEETVIAGDAVTIKDIGTFRKTDIDLSTGKSTIAFVPDASFFEELNRPFDMFEPVELADGVTFDEDEDTEEDKPHPLIETEEVAPVMSDYVIADMPKVEERTAEQQVIVMHDPIIVPPKGTVPTDDDEDDEPTIKEQGVKHRFHKEEKEEEKPSRMWIWFALFLGIACLIGYFVAVWLVPMPDTDFEDEEETKTEEVSDTASIKEIGIDDLSSSIEPVLTEPVNETSNKTEVASNTSTANLSNSPEPVYDTVEISLIKLAKKHFGVADYWVFIFDANRDKIKNPNAIRPGTKVLIPDRSELPGQDASETAAIAKKKSAEYLNK